MDYKDAKKAVQADKPRENYLKIKLAWDDFLILPYKDGLAFMASLAQARVVSLGYSSPPEINGLGERFETLSMTAEEYDRIKIAALLRVQLKDIPALENPPPQPVTP
jgi:hypothetical protein